ncbi:MAG: hypothetical protein V7K90_16670 [Nostoc sp.]|uniref:hypothetical protein n=1 Tax=Nostoc sp. TaxID=1180 RepID=UPI002FF4D0E8
MREARQQGKVIRWAKQQFEQQLADFKSKAKVKWWQLWLPWLVWDLPVRLGRIAKLIGGAVDDVSNWIIGMVILLLLVLVLVGVLHWNEVWDFVRDKLGIK